MLACSAGAAPQLAYALLIQLLAEAGFLVVATPFKVTFFHAECAKAVHQVCTRFAFSAAGQISDTTYST